MNRKLLLFLCVLLAFSSHSQNFKLLHNTLWVNKNYPKTIQLSNADSTTRFNPYFVYCRSVAYCMSDEHEKAKRNFDRLMTESSLNAVQKSKISLALQSCNVDCKLKSFSNDFYPKVNYDSRIVRYYTVRLTASTSSASTVHTIHNKFMSTYKKGMSKIVYNGNFMSNIAMDYSYRIFEDFNTDNIKFRLPEFTENKNFQLFESSRFRIVSFTHNQWSEEAFMERNKVLEQALVHFDWKYGLKTPPMPTTIYLVKNKNELSSLARELHQYDVTHNSIGYSSSVDQSVLAITPNFYLGTINHELVHLLIKFNNIDVPDWIEEGLASAYEVCSFKNKEAMYSKVYADTAISYNYYLQADQLKKTNSINKNFVDLDNKRSLLEIPSYPNDLDTLKQLVPAHNWRHKWFEAYLREDLEMDLSNISNSHQKVRLISRRIREFEDQQNFYGMINSSQVDIFQQNINVALARYYVLFLIDKGMLKFEYNNETVRINYPNSSEHGVRDFLGWYQTKYSNQRDHTYDDNFEFYKENQY